MTVAATYGVRKKYAEQETGDPTSPMKVRRPDTVLLLYFQFLTHRIRLRDSECSMRHIEHFITK